MNPIAKKLLYSTLGGVAPGAIVGAAASSDENRLRNALIGAGLGGVTGAGLYSAKRLVDVSDLNKAYDNVLSEMTPRASTMDDLPKLDVFLTSRDSLDDYSTSILKSVGNVKRSLASDYTRDLPERLKYSPVEASTGKVLRNTETTLPFTDAYFLQPDLPGQRGNVYHQYDPSSRRTFFHISDTAGRQDRVGRLIREELSFSLPGEASELAKNIDTSYLDELMKGYSDEIGRMNMQPFSRSGSKLDNDQIKRLFSRAENSPTTRKIVDLGPKLDQGSRASFFEDSKLPSFGVVDYAPDINNIDGPIKVPVRVEKTSSLKLTGKSRLKQALINAAVARRR